MTDLSSPVAKFEQDPNSDLKVVIFQTRDDVDATNTYDVTLADYGIAETGLLEVDGWVHTTSGSVMTKEANTTTVSSGVLQITIAAGTNDDVRVFRIVGIGYAPTYAA